MKKLAHQDLETYLSIHDVLSSARMRALAQDMWEVGCNAAFAEAIDVIMSLPELQASEALQIRGKLLQRISAKRLEP